MNVLVTGGAGYMGATPLQTFCEKVQGILQGGSSTY